MMTPNARRLAAPAYLIAFLFCLVPLMDFVVATYPMQPGTLKWRTGALGLLAGVWLVPLLGNLIAMVTAYIMGHRGVNRTIAALQLMVAILMLGVLGLFALDVIAFRQSIPPENEPGYLMAVSGAFTKHLSAVIALIVLAVTGIRISRPEIIVRLPADGAAPQPLVIPTGALPVQQQR
jgi:hypothetical protein